MESITYGKTVKKEDRSALKMKAGSESDTASCLHGNDLKNLQVFQDAWQMPLIQRHYLFLSDSQGSSHCLNVCLVQVHLR